MASITESILHNCICNAIEQPIQISQLITSLSYNELVRDNIIPDLTLHIPEFPTKRYPSWVYRLKRDGYENVYYQFELFMENIIVLAIQRKDCDYVKIWEQCGTIPIDKSGLANHKYFQSIQNVFTKAFNTTTNIDHHYDLNHKTLQGCLSLIQFPSDDNIGWILDVRTIGNFNKMKELSLLQVLSYGALARACNHSINHIGILLSLQIQILWFDISEWDSSLFQAILIREAGWVREDQLVYSPELLFQNIGLMGHSLDQVLCAPNIIGGIGVYVDSDLLGSHISINSAYPIHTPFQIYLAGNQSRHLITDAKIEEIRTKCSPGCQLFIHASLTINLSSSEAWPCQRLHHELQSGQKLNARGVVVHVGKYTNRGFETGLQQMIESIERVLPSASPKCPLLIETPAGEGTELCTSIEQLQSVYSYFKTSKYESVRGHLKICVDTCHVFAAGYNPAYYLKNWLQKYPQSIALVHFNDSKNPRGSRIDRHYPAGLGYIGYPRLWKVHELCRKNSIPMVRE